MLFARPPKPRRIPIDIGTLVTLTADLLKSDRAARDLSIEISGSLPAVPADAEMLKMVIQNLLINGAHAMQGRGILRVALEHRGQLLTQVDEKFNIESCIHEPTLR